MPDESADKAGGRSRRSAFAKIGAVAAGAWVAPQVLSTQAASAQSAPTCACPVGYGNAYQWRPPGIPVIVPSTEPVPFDNLYLPTVGMALLSDSFTVYSAGTYRVTYSLEMGGGQASFAVTYNGTTVPFSGLDLAGGQMRTRVVLVVATLPGDVLQIVNVGSTDAILSSNGSETPFASFLVELVA